MRGQGHYWCQNCGHGVYARFGGCRTCQTPLADLMMLDLAIDLGYASAFGGILFDPYIGGFGFDPFGPAVIIEEPVVIEENVFTENDVYVDDGYTDGGYDSDYGGGDF